MGSVRDIVVGCDLKKIKYIERVTNFVQALNVFLMMVKGVEFILPVKEVFSHQTRVPSPHHCSATQLLHSYEM